MSYSLLRHLLWDVSRQGVDIEHAGAAQSFEGPEPTKSRFDGEWWSCFLAVIDSGVGAEPKLRERIGAELEQWRQNVRAPFPPVSAVLIEQGDRWAEHWMNMVDAFRMAAPEGMATSAPWPDWPGLEPLSQSITTLGSPEARRHSQLSPPWPPAPARDGMLWLDAAFLDHLTGFGKHGKERAAELRDGIRQAYGTEFQWTMWLDRSDTADDEVRETRACRALVALAQVIWLDQIKPLVDEAVRRCETFRAPAMIEPLVRSLVQSAASVVRVEGGLIIDSSGKVTGLSISQQQAPSTTEKVIALLSEKLNALERPYLWYLTHFLLSSQIVQARAGHMYPNEITITGGMEGLRKALGITSSKASAELRKLLDLMAGVTYDQPNRFGAGLLSYDCEKAAPGRTPQLTVHLGKLLDMDAIFQDKRGNHMLIPIVNQRMLPRPTGNKPTFAKQRNAAQVLMVMMAERSDQYAEQGAVRLIDKDWNRLARDAGLYQRTHADLMERTRERWIEGDKQTRIEGGGGPLIIPEQGDRYRLGPDHQDTEEHLVEQGRRRLEGKARAKAKGKPKRRNKAK